MGKQGKRKWEIEFDTLSAMNIDDEIAKLEGKGKTKEEYKANKNKIEELKAFKENKLKAFKENKPKIERLRAFRDKYEAIKEKLTNENNTLKSEMQSLQTSKLDLIKLQAEQTKIDEEHKILAQKRIEIEEKIKNATTDEERESLRLEFENNEKKIINNDNRFIANQNSLKSKLENQQRDPKAIQKKIEENEKKIKNASEIISKCNMICHAILEGKSWDDIEVKLAEWQHAKFRGKTEAVKTEPAKAEPAEAEPVKAEPAKAESAKAESAKTEPAKAEPIKAEPVKAEPVKAEPAKAEPAEAEPAKAEPVKAEPAKAEPAKAEPAEAEPAKAEPVLVPVVKNKFDWRHPIKSIRKIIEDRKQNATKAEPAEAEPVKAEPVKAEPAKAEPAEAEPVKAEPKKLSREASFYQKIAEGEALKAARDKANQTAKEKGDPWRGR